MSFIEKTEKKTESKPPSDGGSDIESCIKQKVSEGMNEEEARGYCEKQQEGEGEKVEKKEEVNVEKKEEVSQEPKQDGVEEIVDDPNAPQDPNKPNAPPNPNAPQDPNAPQQPNNLQQNNPNIDPNAPPNPNAAPPTTGTGFGQYNNFEACIQDQLAQGLNNKDGIVNCAAQLLQTMESQGLAAPNPFTTPPNTGMNMQPTRNPYAASYNVSGVDFNVAEFPDFEACVVAYKGKGMEKEAAINQCKTIFGAKIDKVPTAAQPVQIQTAKDQDKLYIRAFLLDSSLNKNFWGVNSASIDQRIRSFVGRPLVLTEDFGHPELKDMAFGHALQYQDVYRIGTIIDVIQTAKSEFDKNKKVWYAVIEVTDDKAKEAFKDNKLPLYVSPAVAKMNVAEEDGQLEEWLGMHLALVDKPAFGVQKAMITGSCSGEEDKCVMHLRQAKIDKYGYGNCGFCVYEKLTSVLTAKAQVGEINKPEKVNTNPKSVNSSLTSENTQKQLTMSQKTEENKNDVESKAAEAKEEILKAEKEKKTPKNEAFQEIDLYNAKLVRYETENTLLKANIDTLRQQNEKLNIENEELKTANRKAEISNIVTAEIYPDENQRRKMVDMFVAKKLPSDMVAEMYASLGASVKVAKSSNYDARVPIVKSAKTSGGNLDESGSLAKEVRSMFIKGGNA